jgi:hypothetical protein
MASSTECEIESNAVFQAIVVQLSGLVGALANRDAGFRTFEETVLKIANLATRSVLERRLQALSDSLEDELLVNGAHCHRHLEGEVTYHSLCGPLTVRRHSYRRVDERNGKTLVPLELECGLVERATPALGYSVALGYAQGELRSYSESMEAAHRCLPSRSALERTAKAIGTAARSEATRIEAVLRRKERLPKGAHGLSTGLDRVAVPMEEDREPGVPPKTRRRERVKPYLRSKPLPVDVNYRMAYVGTVSVVDSTGEELVTRRYTALPDAEPDEVVNKLMADVRNALSQDDTLPVGILQDGAPELWNAMERGLEKAEVKQSVKTIDRYHLNERLAAALHLVEPSDRTRKVTLSAWNDDLDKSDQAIERIQDWLGERIEAVESNGDDASTDKYLEHLAYLDRNQDRMKYASLKAIGLPVGSGLTEGACKSVVGQRACGSGQRWRPEGIGAALTLRAIHRSERLPPFWQELSKIYSAEIRAAA